MPREMKKVECPRCGGKGASVYWRPYSGICYQCDGARVILVPDWDKELAEAFKLATSIGTSSARIRYQSAVDAVNRGRNPEGALVALRSLETNQ
tara:strand:+ start:689 stop:970 length:282 start_codon:yes stop_codon:yes gene_type:complete